MKNPPLIDRVLDRWPVKVICVALAVVLYILFRVNTITERQITVDVQVLTSEGFVVSSEYPGSVNVTMRGEDDDVRGVLEDDIEAYLNMTPYPEEGEYQVPIELRKKGTALQPDALELRARPRDVIVSQEKRMVRSLVVQPELSGFPALGFELTQFFVSPSSVTAVGPQSQLAVLDELKTELIDLSGRKDDFTVTTRIVRPSPQIELPGGQVVEFRGAIEEKIVTRTIADREIVVFDLPESLRVDGELARVSILIQGSQLEVEEASPQDMTFYVDASRIVFPGEYTLPLKMDIPAGLAVLQLLPREVTLDIVIRDDGVTEGVP